MALSATQVWEVRATGNDANGGAYNSAKTGVAGSLDYSQQDSPQVTIDNSAIVCTTPGASSNVLTFTSGYTPTAADVGNVVNVTAGTNVNAGRYEITAYTSTTWTLTGAANLTTAGGAGSAIAGRMGGALASPGAAAGAGIVAGNVVYIKYNATPYAIGSGTANTSGNRPAPAAQSSWIGYVAARGDVALWGTMPSLQATGISYAIFTVAANDIAVEGLEFDGNSKSGVSGMTASGALRLRGWNCRAKNCTTSYGFGSTGVGVLHYCESINNSVGFYLSASFRRCVSRSNASDGFRVATTATFTECVAYSNGGDGFGNGFSVIASRCAAIANTGAGFNLDNALCVADSCIAYGNTGIGFACATTARPDVKVFNSAAGANTGGNISANLSAANAPFVLTIDPFVNRAGLNFALNSTAGGGALLRGTGTGAYPGGFTTSFSDVGPAQHQDAGTNSVSNGSWMEG